MTDATRTIDPPIPTLPPEKVRAAALTVCRRAHDIDDARLLLDALGLADGADEDGEHHLVILRHTWMNPWLIDDRNGISYIDLYFRHLEQRIAALLPTR